MLHAPLPTTEALELWLQMARGRLERERRREPSEAAWRTTLESEALRHLTESFGVSATDARADLTLELAKATDPARFLEELVLRQRMLIHFKHVDWAAPAIRKPWTKADESA